MQRKKTKIHIILRGDCGVMVTAVVNERGDPSSNPG